MIQGIMTILEALGLVSAFGISVLWIINEGYEANRKGNIKKEIALFILAVAILFGIKAVLGV